MSREAFDAIRAGMEDALAYAKGDKKKARIHKVKVSEVNVSALRQRLGLTQREFADVFDVKLGTLRHWEQGRRRPEGPAQVLLKVIEKDPAAVLGAVYPKLAKRVLGSVKKKRASAPAKRVTRKKTVGKKRKKRG